MTNGAPNNDGRVTITHRDLALVTEKSVPFSGRGWIYEIKHHGWRCLAMRAGAEVCMLTREGTDITQAFPELVYELRSLPDLVLDGELAVLDDQGRPQFDRILPRAEQRERDSILSAAIHSPAVLFAFDLLVLRGKDMRALPLVKRKAALERALKGSERVRYLSHTGEQGKRLYAVVEQLGLEGIVAKRAASPYALGRSKDWVKIKTSAGETEQAKRSESLGPAQRTEISI